MTNHTRAAEILWEKQLSGLAKPQDLVDALDSADLLRPDLPSPERAYDDPTWQEEYRESWEDEFREELIAPSVWTGVGMDTTLQVFPGDGQVQVYYDGEPEEPVDADEAWKIGLKWLAAAQLAKELK